MSGFLLVFEGQKKAKLNTELTNPLSLSSEFGTLAKEIENIKTTIGNKDAGLRKTLDEQCKYQCNNKQALECYTK